MYAEAIGNFELESLKIILAPISALAA